MTENRSTEALYSEDNTIEEETSQSQMSENSEDLEPIVIQTDEKEDTPSKRDYLRYDDDEYDTKSSTDIKIVEDDCYYLFDLAANIDGEDYKLCKENGILDENHRVLFQRKSHITFAEKLLKCIPSALGKQYHSRPWMIFHLLHSLTILKCPHKELDDAVLKYIDECQSIYGGYSQSKYGYPHLMVTYAAIMSIAIVGKEEGFQSIHRQSLYHLFLSLKHADGSFSVHENGESDIRGTYCVLSICKLLNMLTDEITANVSSYIHSLLSYEGGYAGTLGGEAHGGYNHCALACLHILNEDFYTPELDLWLTLCQSPFEGGFAGRTAKLVDGCYTYYQGAGMELVAQNRPQNHSLSCNEEGIKQYVMEITQDIDYYAHTVNGGLRDKPNYMTDPYHTCFVLSGISILDETGDAFDLDFNDPVYNISFQQIASIVNYFKDKPITSSL